ncbi:hypothetical protein NDU88_001482 [Pleurodeles waltl]|uniref:F-box domain-containing protein n=2 Tax=Pleurodeles waltl TaxID=8319 RepID=A0AAV7MKM2_PLEWA|nr:hypothetical protein NDU88_001482 [Pleurodeles waltl]
MAMEVKRFRRACEVRRCRGYQKKFVLPVNWLLLPQEIFLKIFMHLSPNDKANIRATCSHFRTLIDHPALWKKSVFVFRDIGIFNVNFLKMLKTRKVCSVEVCHLKLYHWKRLIATVPDLLNITVHSCLTDEAIKGMKPLTNLQRLQLTNCSGLQDQKLLSDVCHFQQLTHLWLCDLTLSSSKALVGLCQLHNLFSLLIHSKDGFVPKNALRQVLFQLPKLKELSLSVHNMCHHSMSFCFSPPEILEGNSGESGCVPRLHLQKLEFIKPGFTVLSATALRQLSTVTTLCLQHYKAQASDEDLLHLMLQNLPNVTELKLAWSSLFYPTGPVSWIRNLPSTLEVVHLFTVYITEPCFSALFSTTSKLRLLDVSFCYGFKESILKRIPWEFPLLTKLYLSNIPLTDDTLLTLAHLAHLEELDISNNHVLTPDAIVHFRGVTKNSVNIIRKRPATTVACQIFSTLYE